MRITERRMTDLTVLELVGKITIGSGDSHLRDAVLTALAVGPKNVVLNLAKVTGLDSAGVGELMSAHATATRRGGRLALAEVPPRVLGVLESTLLTTVLDSYDTEQEAIAALEP
jgi:anti-sigma B factor antagonist